MVVEGPRTVLGGILTPARREDLDCSNTYVITSFQGVSTPTKTSHVRSSWSGSRFI